MKQIIVGLLLLLILPGCNLSREDEGAGDIQSFVPPVKVANQVEGAVVRLEPITTQIDVGGNTTVQIQIDNVTDLVGVDIELQYNQNLLQVQDADSITDGTQIQPGDFLAATFVTGNQADNKTGVIRYSVAQTDISPVSGNGILALVTFLGVSPGNNELSFTTVKLTNNQAKPIAVTPQSGQITINTLEPQETLIASEPTAIPEQEASATLPSPPTAETQTSGTQSEPEATQSPAETTTPPEPTATQNPACRPVPKGPTPDPNICPPTPAPTMPSYPPDGTLGFCYQVKYHDTIYSIAHDYNTSAEVLNIVNDLWPKDMVYAHMALFIPTQLGYGPNFYITKAGDTLQNISEVCHIKVWTIIKVNGLDHNIDPEATLEPDTVLEIPIPPFPPPAKFKFPISPFPPVIPPPIAPYAAP